MLKNYGKKEYIFKLKCIFTTPLYKQTTYFMNHFYSIKKLAIRKAFPHYFIALLAVLIIVIAFKISKHIQSDYLEVYLFTIINFGQQINIHRLEKNKVDEKHYFSNNNINYIIYKISVGNNLFYDY